MPLLAPTGWRLTRESSISSTRGACLINRALVESLDWDAVLAWLDR